MATYLIKTEPDVYSYDDLARDKRTEWDGVTSPAAQKFMRGIVAGDELLVYHTGNEKRVAGLGRVVRGAYPDPAKPGETAAGDTKFVLFDLEPLKPATKTVTLADIKADRRFDGFELVRQPRLGVLPVPASMNVALRKLAGL